MSNETQVVVVSIDTLKELISTAVKEQLTPFEQRLKEALPDKKPLSDRLYINDVAKLLGGISRPTIDSYRKQGILPPPQYTSKNRPYWTREQIKQTLSRSKNGWKFDL